MNSTLLPLTTPEEELAYSLGYGVGMGLFICLIALIFILLIFLAVGYIFQALAIKGMYNKLGLRNGWLAFIPYANIFALGKVAEQYVHPYGKKNINIQLF